MRSPRIERAIDSRIMGVQDKSRRRRIGTILLGAAEILAAAGLAIALL